MPSFVHYWQYGGGCLVTNFVPRVNRKSHGYLVGSPWQWRKQKSCFVVVVVKYLLSEVRCLLVVTVWLGAHPKCSGAGLSSSGLIRSRGSGGDFFSAAEKMNENSSMFPCQPEYLLRMTQSLASSLPSAANQTLSIKNVLWTTFSLNGLAGPSPLKKRKKQPPNITRHNMHLPCCLQNKKTKPPPKLKVQ